MIFHPTNKENIFHLAPIPVYKRRYVDCPVTKKINKLGFKILTQEQKRMGQELPDKYDKHRQDNYEINYDYQEANYFFSHISNTRMHSNIVTQY